MMKPIITPAPAPEELENIPAIQPSGTMFTHRITGKSMLVLEYAGVLTTPAKDSGRSYIVFDLETQKKRTFFAGLLFDDYWKAVKLEDP